MDMIEQQIIHLLKDKDEDITINEIANTINVDRHTAAKRLDVLKSKGLVEFRTIGKSKVWKISKSPFLNALQNNDDIANNIKNILQHVDGHVNIIDNDKIVWSNKNKHNCCSNGHECKDCAVEKTLKTGKTATSLGTLSKKRVKITTQPIKDQKNKTIAVVEIIRDAR